MGLPADLERIAKETAEIEKSILEGQKKAEADKTATDKSVPQPTAGDTPPAVDQTVVDKAVQDVPPVDGKPSVDALPANPPPDKPVDWEHKYRVLQGKYDKEVPRYAADLRVSNDRTIALQTENAQLRESQVKKPDDKPAVDTSTALDKIPEIQYLKNEYPQVWEAVHKTVVTLVGDTHAQVERLTKQLEATNTKVEKSDHDKFYDYLNENVKGWETVNNDPAFWEWLGTPERYTGVAKTELIRDAVARFDGRTTSAFFEDFAKEKSNSNTQIPNLDIDGDTDRKKDITPLPKRDEVVYPPKGRNNPPPPRKDDNVEYIKAADVTKFYNDVLRGVYTGRDAIKQAEEMKIEKAAAEGRVID